MKEDLAAFTAAETVLSHLVPAVDAAFNNRDKIVKSLRDHLLGLVLTDPAAFFEKFKSKEEGIQVLGAFSISIDDVQERTQLPFTE
jgi:hypothetical protein